MLPYYPETEKRGQPYDIYTISDKLVMDYARLTWYELADLDLYEYLLLRRDAFIHTARQTEEGEKYLNNAWRLEQTKPERGKLREKFGAKRRAKRGGQI